MTGLEGERQQLLRGGAAAALTLTVLGVGFARWTPAPTSQDLLTAGLLLLGIAAAFRFPIYLRHSTKLCIFSIPLFMLAALTPPIITGITATLAVLAGELLVRKRTGTLAGDVLLSASRWGLTGTAACIVAQLQFPLPELSLAAAAVVLWAGDMLTLPILLCPIAGEPPLRVLRTVIKEGGPAEGAQYAVAILGVVLVRQVPWAIPLFLVPAGILYLAFRTRFDPHTLSLLKGMVEGVEARDPYMNGHSRRVETYVNAILTELGMQGMEAEHIRVAARLHDLGTVHVSSDLHARSVALTADDYTQLRDYPEHGARLLAAYPDLSRVLEMVRHHHEAWDGSGYPAGLEGTGIPFGARVIAVADAFDAMTSERAYRPALTPERAAEILCDGQGRQWDPGIVDVFLSSQGLPRRPGSEAQETRQSENGLPAGKQMPA